MKDTDQTKNQQPKTKNQKPKQNKTKQNSSERIVTKQTAHSEGHVGKRAGTKKKKQL